MNLKYIVTGTGRCGTLFMANLLTSMGHPCSHEAIFTPQGWGWARDVLNGFKPPISSKISKGDNLSDYEMEIVGESSYMAAPFLSRVNSKVIHVVRNPFSVIGSLIGWGFNQFTNKEPTDIENDPDHFQYEKFIYENLPELKDCTTQLDRGCLFYVRWNEMIEKSGKVCLFHRIEDGPQKIVDFFGFKGECYDNSSCNSSADKSRKWFIREIKDCLIKKQLFEMIEKYGYQSELRKRMIL